MRLLLVAVLVFPHFCLAQYPGSIEIKQNQLITYGTAEKDYVTDRARLRATFSGVGRSLDAALADLRPKVATVARKLTALGLTEDAIQTARFNAGENSQGASWWSSAKDFKVMMQMSITVDSVTLLDPIVTMLMKEQVDNVTPIWYELRDIEAKKLEMIELAALNAKQNAEVTAKALGAVLLKPLYIDTQSIPQTPRRAEITMTYEPPIISSIHEIRLMASMRVVYELGYPK